jgi:hypothetical protein
MAKDINIDEPFKDGDFNITECDEQNIRSVLLAHPGHFKMSPLIGVGIQQFQNAPLSPAGIASLEREIILQLQADGAKNVVARINSVGEMKISAVYEDL